MRNAHNETPDYTPEEDDGWRRELEDKFTVTCPACECEWVYPSRKPRQKWVVCDSCLKRNCTRCGKSWINEEGRSIGRGRRLPKPRLCPLCCALAAREDVLWQMRDLLKEMHANGMTSAKYLRDGAGVRRAPAAKILASYYSETIADLLTKEGQLTGEALQLQARWGAEGSSSH